MHSLLGMSMLRVTLGASFHFFIKSKTNLSKNHKKFLLHYWILKVLSFLLWIKIFLKEFKNISIKTLKNFRVKDKNKFLHIFYFFFNISPSLKFKEAQKNNYYFLKICFLWNFWKKIILDLFHCCSFFLKIKKINFLFWAHSWNLFFIFN